MILFFSLFLSSFYFWWGDFFYLSLYNFFKGGFYMDKISVGRFISEQRKAKQLTQKQLAEHLNITDKAVSKWETGKSYPDIEVLEKLSNLFNVTINDILSGQIISQNNIIEQADKNIIDIMRNTKKVKNKSIIVISLIMIIFIVISSWFSFCFIFNVPNCSLDTGVLSVDLDYDTKFYEDTLKNDFLLSSTYIELFDYVVVRIKVELKNNNNKSVNNWRCTDIKVDEDIFFAFNHDTPEAACGTIESGDSQIYYCIVLAQKNKFTDDELIEIFENAQIEYKATIFFTSNQH